MKINFIFTSGLPDALNLETRDRRYTVVSHMLCPVCEFSYNGGHHPDCPRVGVMFGMAHPSGFTDQQLRVGYLKAQEERKAAEAEHRRRQEEVRREYGQNARIVTDYSPNRAQRRAQAHAKRAQAGKNSRNNPKRSK